MAEPSIDQIGHLIRLTCGHNGRLSDIEMGILSMHLERAGFNGGYTSQIGNNLDQVRVSPVKLARSKLEPNKPRETPLREEQTKSENKKEKCQESDVKVVQAEFPKLARKSIG